MKKGFMFQRIGFFLYLFMLLVAAAYALSFMTDYGNLFGFVYLENKFFWSSKCCFRYIWLNDFTKINE